MGFVIILILSTTGTSLVFELSENRVLPKNVLVINEGHDRGKVQDGNGIFEFIDFGNYTGFSYQSKNHLELVTLLYPDYQSAGDWLNATTHNLTTSQIQYHFFIISFLIINGSLETDSPIFSSDHEGVIIDVKDTYLAETHAIRSQ